MDMRVVTAWARTLSVPTRGESARVSRPGWALQGSIPRSGPVWRPGGSRVPVDHRRVRRQREPPIVGAELDATERRSGSL